MDATFWGGLIGALIGGFVVIVGVIVAENLRRQREDAVKLRILRAEARVVRRICEQAPPGNDSAQKAEWLAAYASGFAVKWDLAVAALKDEKAFRHFLNFHLTLRFALSAANSFRELREITERIRRRQTGPDRSLPPDVEESLRSGSESLDRAVVQLKESADQVVKVVDRLIAEEPPTAEF